MRKLIAFALSLIFYVSILPWSNAEYFSTRHHNATSDNGVLSGFDNGTFNSSVRAPVIGSTSHTDNVYANKVVARSPCKDVESYNTALTGTAIQNAIDNASAGDRVCLDPTKTYSITAPITITKALTLTLGWAKLQATTAIDSIIQIGSGLATFTGPVMVERGTIDGNGLADSGIKITTSPSYKLDLEHLKVINNNMGLNFYGADNQTITNVNVVGLLTNKNNYGAYFDKAGNGASFAQFTFMYPAFGDNTACVYAVNGSTGLIIVGGHSQPQDGGSGIVLDNSATITLDEHYIEPFTGHPSLSLANSSTARIIGGLANSMTLDNSSFASVMNGNIYTYTVDNTSTLSYSGYTRPNAVGYTSTPAITGKMSDTTTWGDPYWPAKGTGGAILQKGYRYTDKYGVVWTATTSGNSTSVARFSAMDGKIIIPITDNTYADGAIIWFPQEDFVVTNVSLVVTEAWADGTDVGIYRLASYPSDNTTRTYSYIDNNQGAAASLTLGAVITSGKNTGADNVFVDSGELFLSGVPVSAVSDGITGKSSLRWHTDGTWSAGAGYIVIRGYYLKYN
jgi:hypothetical protein